MMSPQHFQQQDLYHETLLGERVGATQAYAWGVVALELDEPALDAGQIAIRGFRGILPQGTVLRFESAESEAPATRAVEGHFEAQRTVLEVYLGVPLERVGVSGYARSEAARGHARFVIETRNVIDGVSALEEESVDFARRNVVLLFGDEAREDFECIKIAEVVRDGSGRNVFSHAYLPPSLRVDAAIGLQANLKRVLALAVARQRTVAEERRHRDKAAVEYAADDVTRFLALNALGGAIPWLKHAAELGELSPFQAYLLLVQLAGQLSAFATDEDPSLLPSYIHADPRKTFDPLFAKLTSLLRVAVSTRVVIIPFEARQDGMHLARVQDEQLHKPGVRVFLCVQAAMTEQQIYELAPRVAKLASWGEIPQLVHAATSGVPLVATPRPPREIPMRAGKAYFALSTEHPVWRGIAHERAVAVHLPPPFDPKSTVVELVAIPAE